MQKNKIKGLLRNSFLLSLLLHLLLLLSVSIVIILKPKENKKPPHLYIPSYVYKGPLTPFHPNKSRPYPKPLSVTHEKSFVQNNNQTVSNKKSILKEKETDQKATLITRKEVSQKKIKMVNRQKQPVSMLEASFATLKAEQMKSMQRTKEAEPVLLVGDLNQVADPIIKLMAQSLSAHFRYPDTEGMLGIKGRVIIELVLHPEGKFTDIHMLKSSDNQNLDAAALYAANTAPRVVGANRFLSHPTRFVVGFVFN